jgi:hypothetical protein
MRLTPGAALLWYRQTFGHGFGVAWHRDVTRKRILSLPPVAVTDDPRCEVHILTSGADWLNMLWCLRSFYWASRTRYRLYIHEDGSLGEDAARAIRDMFPQARLVMRSEADAFLQARFRSYPNCLEFRRRSVMAPKILDFCAYGASERLLVLDSDLIFYSRPAALIARIEDGAYSRNAFNTDLSTRYVIPVPELERRVGFPIQERVNAGLGLIQRASIDFDLLERWLDIPGVMEGDSWLIEQTLYALASSRHGVELLPEDYSISLAEGRFDVPVRHFVGAIRHLMYGEGMRVLAGTEFMVWKP